MDQAFFRESFGAILKAARLKKGISQYALAEAAGVGRRFIQGVENGHHEAKLTTLFSLAAAMGASPAQLVADLEYALANNRLPDGVRETLPPKRRGRPSKTRPSAKPEIKTRPMIQVIS